MAVQALMAKCLNTECWKRNSIYFNIKIKYSICNGKIEALRCIMKVIVGNESINVVKQNRYEHT